MVSKKAVESLGTKIWRDVVLDRRGRKERRSGMDGAGDVVWRESVFTLVATKGSLLVLRTKFM